MELLPSQTSSIDSLFDKIAPGSEVIFDWDNTLKVTSADRKHIKSSVHPEALKSLYQDKNCELYIISAIRPTRMNLDTLMMEVDRLGLRSYFCPKCKRENLVKDVCSHDKEPCVVCPHPTYAAWGNIVICGYDKAEVFLALRGNTGTSGYNHNEGKPLLCNETEQVTDLDMPHAVDKRVYFFDDEEVNIENFRQIVRNSECVLVK